MKARNARSLGERLFAARFDLVRALDEKRRLNGADDDTAQKENVIRNEALAALQAQVATMNFDNFLVREKRRVVEKYKEIKAWDDLSDETRNELIDDVAPLPSESRPEPEAAKRFDLLMFCLELAVLKGTKTFDRLKKQLIEIASALDEQTAIPAIAAQHALILDLISESWWEGVNVPALEQARLRLRDLVQHIEPGKRVIVYTDFADELGEASAHDLPDVGAVDFARFKKKARHFLRAHEDHIVLAKLRSAKPLTPTDLRELEQMLIAAGVGDAADLEKANEISHGFGLFVRSLVGLDRPAVADAFSEFVADGVATADQIEFVEMVIDHLTEKGAMDPGLLYESPFIDIAPTGPQEVFPLERARKLITVITNLNATAAGA